MKAMWMAIGITAIVAPGLHLVSDVLEWTGGGFSRTQLLVNYVAFLPMPFLLLGLHAWQGPKARWSGLVGAVIYGLAFVYFTHTTLLALEESVPDYETLWHRLGWVYTVHGGLMIAGAALFGAAALEARVLSRTGVRLFLLGAALNLAVGLAPLPDIVQTVGSTVRNLGLMGMGMGVLRDRARVAALQPASGQPLA